MSISFLKFSEIFLIHLGFSYIGYIYVYVYIFLMDSSLKYYGPSLCLFMFFVVKSILSHVSIATLAFFFFSVHLLGKFVSSPSLSVCVGLLSWGGSFVGSIFVDHAFLSIQLFYVFWLEHLIHLHLRLLLIGTYSLLIFCACIPLFLSFSSFP